MDEIEQTSEAPVAAADEPRTEAQPAAATKTPGSKSPLARPLPTYIVQGRLQHDGQTYLNGATFSSPDERLIADLRRLGALVLPEELASAETLAAQAAAREEQVRQQQDEIEALRRQIAVLQSGKGGLAPKGK